MSAKIEFQAFLKQFADKNLVCSVTVSTNGDDTPLDGGSKYVLHKETETIKILAPNEEQQKQILSACGRVIALCFKKEKVLKFIKEEGAIRIYIFQAYKDFLITIRNHGKGHWYQIYEITVIAPE